MSSVEGVIKVPNDSYMYKVNWDVVAAMNARGRKYYPNENLIFMPLYDPQLSVPPYYIESDEMTYPCDLNSSASHSAGPKINFQFFLEKDSIAKGTFLIAKLCSDKSQFEIQSASVRFKNYLQKFTAICDVKESCSCYGFGSWKTVRFEKLNCAPTSTSPRFRTYGRALTGETCVQWAKLAFLSPETIFSFKCLNFDFLIQPKGTRHSQIATSEPGPSLRIQGGSLLFSHEYSDVTISCGLKEYRAHKVFICSKSSVLKTMFEQPMAENLMGKLKIEDTEPEIVEEFLRFIYTGAVSDLAKNAAGLFRIAHKYDVQELKNMSEQSILKTMKRDNVLEVYGLGKLLSSDAIVRRSVEKIKEDKNLLWETKEEKLEASRQFPELFFDMLFLE